MKSYNHLVSWALEQPWAVTPRMLQVIQGILAERLSGNLPSADVIAGRIAEERDLRAATARQGGGRVGAIAVLPIYGVLMQRADMMMEMSGGTSTESLSKAFRALMADPSVGTIVLDIDSPGGGVYGVQELAEEILKARGQKRVVAVANSMAASAAYWLAAPAEEIVVTPGGEVGSIGCYMIHEDWSGAYEQAGVAPTIIQFGANKTLGTDVAPLSDEAREYLQTRVDRYGEAFVTGVAKARGVSRATVMKDFGQGKIFGAKDAVALKMADRVGTLEETLVRLAGRAGSRSLPGAYASEPLEYDANLGAWTASDITVTVMTGVGAEPEPEPEPEQAEPEPAPEPVSQADPRVRHRHSRTRVLTP